MIVELDGGTKIELPDGSSQADIEDAANHISQNAPTPPADPVFTPKQGFNAELAQGALLGGGDEAIAGVSALQQALAPQGRMDDLGKYYDQALDTTRQGMKEYTTDHPYMATAANVYGGLAGTGAALLTGGATAPELSLGGKMLQGGKVGAAVGGVSGFNNGEGGFENRLDNAADDATTYGLLSAALPLGVQGVKTVGGGLVSGGK